MKDSTIVNSLVLAIFIIAILTMPSTSYSTTVTIFPYDVGSISKDAMSTYMYSPNLTIGYTDIGLATNNTLYVLVKR
jgi:hypothetical protein